MQSRERRQAVEPNGRGAPPRPGSPAPHATVVVPKAARLVADTLKERILGGGLGAGDLLPSMEELRADFGVSRPTLRDALNLLEREGLVRLKRGPGGGALVRAPDSTAVTRALEDLLRWEGTSLLQLMEVRTELEPTGARLAALRATDEDFAALEQSLERQERPEVLRDPAAWMEENLVFHRQIAFAARNPVLRVMAEALNNLIHQTGLLARYTTADRRRSIQQHRELLELLRARDGGGAEALLRRHLEASAYVRKGLIRPSQWGH